MIDLSRYIERISSTFSALQMRRPWQATQHASEIILQRMSTLSSDYKIFNNVAIHETVNIDSHAIIKGPAIISKNCFIGAHCYIRGGVFLDENVSLGPGCEVKTSFIFAHTALGHFNFVGDSILGAHVNMEAGSVIANHYNERKDKSIFLIIDGNRVRAEGEKFGALVGDHSKIGANAVLSPGTVLNPGSIVKRLELIEQSPEGS